MIAWNQTSLHSSSPASSVNVLAHFYKMPTQLLQPVKEDGMLFQACTYLGIKQKKKKNRHGTSKHVKTYLDQSFA